MFTSFGGRCKPSHKEFNYAMLLEEVPKLVRLGLVVYSRYSLQLAPLKTYPNTCLFVLMINILLLWCMHITCTTSPWHRMYVLVVLTAVQGELFDCFDYLLLYMLVLRQASEDCCPLLNSIGTHSRTVIGSVCHSFYQ